MSEMRAADPFEGWDQRSDGMITLDLVITMQVVPLQHEPYVALRITYATGPSHRARIAEGLDQPRVVQLFVTPEAARLFAETLTVSANRLDGLDRPVKLMN